MNSPRSDFDVEAFFAAMDAQRIARGLTWAGVARELWAQTPELNARRGDHPISPATITGMAKRGDTTCQHALFMLRWLGRVPEDFVPAVAVDSRYALPPVDEWHRLRWSLRATYDALDQQRRERAMTWPAVASEIGCTPNRLTGIRTARYAIGMILAMRIVAWLDRPAATFVYPAEW